MNKEIENLLLDPDHAQLTEEEIKIFLESGFVLGSYVYGDPRTAKDFDIAVFNEDPREFDRFIGDKLIYISGYYNKEDFSCFYGVYKGKIINILRFWDKRLYDKYQQVTEIMKVLKKSSPLHEKMNDKKTRVQLFEYFLELI